MRCLRICRGENICDFFLLPTIRFENDGIRSFITLEWLKWYIGISYDSKEKKNGQ